MNNYAGEFLSFYEKTRYSKYDWTRVQYIVVPVDSEELADVSFYQKPMLWNVYAQSKRAVVLRMGQGAWIDPEWDYNYVERQGTAWQLRHTGSTMTDIRRNSSTT